MPATPGNLPTGEASKAAAVADDRFLAMRAQSGDREAFSQLVHLYSERLHAMLLHLANHDRDLAAELTQEAFVRAYERLAQFSGQSSFYTWLYRLARNRAFDLLARKRPVESPGAEPVATGRSALDALGDAELRERLAAALRLLPLASRELLVMREFDGWDYERISHALDVPLGTVKSRLSRARLELHALLAGTIHAEDLS